MAIPGNNPDQEPIIVKQPMGVRGCAWRLGCLIVWLPLILLPLFLLILATQAFCAARFFLLPGRRCWALNCRISRLTKSFRR